MRRTHWRPQRTRLRRGRPSESAAARCLVPQAARSIARPSKGLCAAASETEVPGQQTMAVRARAEAARAGAAPAAATLRMCDNKATERTCVVCAARVVRHAARDVRHDT